MMNVPRRDYRTLDAIVVVGSMVMLSGMIAGFFLVPVAPEIAPILSSIGTGILSLPGMYGAFRWGNSVGKADDPHPVVVSNTPDDPVQVEEAKP